MRIARITDQLLFKLLSSELEEGLTEVTYATRMSYKEDNKNLLRFGKYNEVISEFIELFSKNFTEEQTQAMLYRLKRLSLKEEECHLKVFSSIISLGTYQSETNSIVLNIYDKALPVDMKDILFHELLHMASTKTTQVGFITGLEVPDIFGDALNEGYTEYLTEKYFKTKTHYTDSEDYNVFFAKGIENIVGKEFMEKCYFNANIGLLIKELENYSTREDILKMLFLMDRGNDPFSSSENIRRITEEISKMNARKLKQDLESGVITQDEYDVEYAIKVLEYRKYHLWSEEAKVIKEDNSFILSDRGRTSSLYERTTPQEKNPQFQKKYQE